MKKRINEEQIDISATIVLYNQDFEELIKAITSFLETPSYTKQLFLVDNSPEKNTRLEAYPDSRVTYIFNNKNLGFAKANNLVIPQIANISNYHLILNPDTEFEPIVISKLIDEIEKDKELALITPAVKFPDGKHQYSVRKYPTFFDLVIRKLSIFRRRIHDQEYRNANLSKQFYPEVIHGCFMLFKTDDFITIKGFDERYFLYMEDIDICKKIDVLGKKKLYFPEVTITHALKKGSSKKTKLFLYHVLSAVKYFLKW
ncbi:glycosyltransferase [Tenacibaculum amylolyticum]|uniref:glycosyltransferase n=1 Tax=Tenacibaculum amylolyticum TaxID=104269 RepID=UPI003893DEB9